MLVLQACSVPVFVLGWLTEAAKSAAWARSHSFSSRAFTGKTQFHVLPLACQGATRQRDREAGMLLAMAMAGPGRDAQSCVPGTGTRQTPSSSRMSREMLKGPWWDSCPEAARTALVCSQWHLQAQHRAGLTFSTARMNCT